MPLMPFHVLTIWLRGLFSLVLLGVGIYLVREWYEQPRVVVSPPRVDRTEERGREPVDARTVPVPRTEVDHALRPSRWHLGLDRETAYLVGGLVLIAGSLGGGSLGYRVLKRHGSDDPRATEGTDSARGGTEHRIRRPDGTELRAVSIGPEDAPAIVMTHGWGLNSAEWHYAKEHLADRYRLILWDLAGLGKSSRPINNDWSLEKLARDLEAVLGLAGDRPAFLLGHSIGGMTTLTFCRLFPEVLGRRVSGLVLVHTTYTNPVKTTSMAGLYTALQKPVLEPLCHLMIWLAPLVWLMNWISYLNGSLHRSSARGSFCGHETWEQLDFATRFMPKAWPGVVARGMLGMFRYDATEVLSQIGVPTLVIAGDRDSTCKPEASDVMATTIPAATLVTLQPAKHMGLIEYHARFAEAVDQFVAAHTTEPKPIGAAGG